MKLINVAAFLVWGILTAAQEISNHETQWQDFKTKYVKVYKHAEEEGQRKTVFLENLKFIQEHSKRYQNGEETHEVAVNAFADMTNKEFVTRMLGYRRPKNQTRRGRVFKVQNPGVLVPAVDWRKEGAVTPIKNQVECGSCWAFSATGALEGQHFLKTGELVSLSEQNLVDCSMNEGNFGCGGGDMEYAFQYVIDNKGIDTEKSYPYVGRNQKCKFNASNVGATVVDYVELPEGSEYDLQIAVNQIGPIATAMHASDLAFQFYFGGVYKSKNCSKKDLDHGVLVIGYGVDWRGGDYWLVKNSWGTWWGKKGYFWLARNQDNTCGIASEASYPIV